MTRMTPAKLRALQKRHKLTNRQIAELIHVGARFWQYVLAGTMPLGPAHEELLRIKLGEHDGYGPR